MLYTYSKLFYNGIDFLEVGISDYLSEKRPRLKCAIRHLGCSIELLIKAFILKKRKSFIRTYIFTPNIKR